MKYTTIYNDPWRRAKITEPWVCWNDGFSNEELKKIVDYCDAQGTEMGVTFGANEKKEVEEHRVSKVKFHHRNEDTAWVFDRMNFIIQSLNESFYGFDLNGYSAFQYTTYKEEENGRYDWHMDMNLGSQYDSDAEPRKLSLTLLLNDEFEGGEFQINLGKQETPVTLPAEKGRVLCFPSFILHRVAPITKGVRKSLVIWVTGPKFV